MQSGPAHNITSATPMPDTAIDAAPIVTTRTRRNYSDREQACALAALAANEGAIRKTARELDIPENTLRQWEAGDRRGNGQGTDPEVSARVKDELGTSMEMLARRCIGQANRKLDTMSGSAAIIGAAVCIDKMMLLRGESPGGASATVNVTVNVSAAVLSPQDVHQARSLLSSVIALPSSSETQEGPSLHDCGPSQSDLAERSEENGQPTVPVGT